MSVSLASQVLNTPALNGIISVDASQRISIDDRARAMQILAQCDANSPEYRIIQVSMQLSNFQQQEDLTARVNLGEREVVRLQNDNRRISDNLTSRQMNDDRNRLRSEERMDGFGDLALTIPMTLVFPPALIIGPIMGLSKILTPGSFEMRRRERELELYKSFHPNASLTEAYTYITEHPPKHNEEVYGKYLGRFRQNHPNGTYAEFIQYLPNPRESVLEYTDHGPTGFQLVTRCACDQCERKRSAQ